MASVMASQQTELDDDGVSDRKRANSVIRNNFDLLGLPSRVRDFARFGLDELLTLAVRFNIPSARHSELQKSKDVLITRWYVKTAFVHIRDAAVSACVENEGRLSLHDTQSLLRWQESTAIDVGQEGDTPATSQERRPSRVGSFLESSSQSDVASSAEIHALHEQVKLLTQRLLVVEEERALAADEDDDRTAGGRRLALPQAVLDLLPKDPVREELPRPQLAAILRQYPLPRDYSLKAGELSATEKAKLQPSVADEIARLGKIINRFSDVARPLLSLLSVLHSDEEEGLHAVSIGMVREVVLNTLSLLFHHQTKLETERHVVHFKDEKVLQAAFQKPVRKPFFSEDEKAKLKALADEQKSLRKIREEASGGMSKSKSRRGGPRQRPATAPPASGAPPERSAPTFNKDKDRRTRPSKGKPSHRGGKSGEARGPKASAQQE